MTGAEVRDIIQAFAVLVAAIGGVIAAIKSSQAKSKADEVGAEVKSLGTEAHETAAVADTKLNTIHELTNSNLTRVKTDLELANRKIEELNTLVSTIAAERTSGVQAHPAIIVPVVTTEPPAAPVGEKS